MKGLKKSITLTMMTDTKVQDTAPYSSLNIRGWKNRNSLKINALEQDSIPIAKELIPCRDNAYLPHVRDIGAELSPAFTGDAELLIGIDCSKAFIPEDFCCGNEGQPCALKK